ncbi:hypothetical protein [Rhizobium sp. S163]|uniref:hypothetical protein n=1 Tax=Rhizobium sp. S163 TaxID=3055039 RepID=UPI0025A9B86A|nr:hypothetical protein [Rhizobium sp. S163]MDM9645793.1 hypothetical protein [Rhizobium sp. S163]
MRELPTPDQILEELADKAAAAIERLAPVAFDAAWDEMVRYHRFLLAINATHGPDGRTFNYSEIQGKDWQPPHRVWIRQYGRLFERAADRIPDDTHFIRKLAYAPLSLLSTRDGPKLSTNIINSILDLGPMMMHRIEAWKTKRTTIETSAMEPARPRLRLAGSDAKAYSSVLPDLIGAWESLLHSASAIYGWRDEKRQESQSRWNEFRASWPFLWQHLKNTAYCLAVAVWNEDDEGARYFQEALVRWPESLRLRHPYSELRHRRHLFPNILHREWTDAKAAARSLAYEHASDPQADELFATIVRNAHQDVIMLSAALLLSWSINNKQASDIGARTARALLDRKGGNEHRDASIGERPHLHSLFLDVARFDAAGERYDEASYANELDRLVTTMDNMTERRVVPGRVFTPSTINGREDLTSSFLVILASSVPAKGDDGLVGRLRQLAADVGILPRGDRSLRAISNEIGTLLSVLRSEFSFDAAKPLFGSTENPDFRKRLDEILENARLAIENVRTDLLKSLPISAEVIEELRSAAQARLLEGGTLLNFFQGVKIVQHHGVGTDPIAFVAIGDISKAHMVRPPMETPPVNFVEFLASSFQDKAEMRVWGAFVNRPRVRVELDLAVENQAFWTAIKPYLLQTGAKPVLLVSRSAEGRALQRFVWGHGAKPDALGITRKDFVEGAASYIATIEGVDVFGVDMPAGTAWLFSGELLQQVSYSGVRTSDHCVDLEYIASDDLNGSLRLSYRQKSTWAETPIFEVITPDPDDLDNDFDKNRR